MKQEAPIPLPISLALSLFLWILAVFYTIIFFLLGFVLYLPFRLVSDNPTKQMHFIARRWAKGIMWFNPFWKFEVRGLKNINRNKHYVVVANHQSMLDILVLLAGLPLQFKFVAKRDLFMIPFIGWHMALAGYLSLERGDKASTVKVLTAAKELVRSGMSLLIFPEGTRSVDGQIKGFKNGAFKLAREFEVEVLPVVIAGTRESLPKNSKILRNRSTLIVCVEKPVKAEADFERTRDKVRQQMIRSLTELNREI